MSASNVIPRRKFIFASRRGGGGDHRSSSRSRARVCFRPATSSTFAGIGVGGMGPRESHQFGFAKYRRVLRC